MKTLKSKMLHCQHGSSDKVYYVTLVSYAETPVLYRVIAQYGKRTDQHLKTEIKISTYSFNVAEKKYDSIINQKNTQC